jgi:hypothetical protein
MATLEQLLAQIQSAQNSGTTMADPDAVVAQAQMQLLEALVAAVTTLQSAAPSAAAASVTSVLPTNEQLEALIQPMLQPLVSEAISTAFGRLENLAQPEVAQNTGSGAAPEPPSATAASNGATEPPVAAGTAPPAQA